MAGDTEHEVIGLGRFRPREVACDELGVGQVGYVIANIKRLSDVRIGDTITETPRGATNASARLPGAGAGRLLRPLPGHAQPVRGPSDRLAEARAQRFELHLRARDVRRARASASVAASWACSTWRSSSSGSNARATSRWSRRPPTSPTRSSPARARPSTSRTRPGFPTPARSRSSASRSRGSTSSCRPNRSARSCSSARTDAGPISRPSTSLRPARSCRTSCPWPR